jgi:hypothetical protein
MDHELAPEVIIQMVANRDRTIVGLWIIGMSGFVGGMLLRLLPGDTMVSGLPAQMTLAIQLAGIGIALASVVLRFTVNRCPLCKQRLNWQLKQLHCPGCDARIRPKE